jgi:hypothetical protein
MRKLATVAWVALPILALTAGAALAQVQLSEIRTDHTGADTDEYFELAGAPGTSLTGLTYVVIGDGTGGCGIVENATDLTGFSIQADGFFAMNNSSAVPTLSGYDASAAMVFENSDNVTHLLVSGFTGATGNDLDTDNDGVLDLTPWTAIVDGVAIVGTATLGCAGTSGTSEYTYYGTSVGPDGTFVPGHVFRCPGGWLVGVFALGTDDTPGAANLCPVPADQKTWGSVKQLYND